MPVEQTASQAVTEGPAPSVEETTVETTAAPAKESESGTDTTTTTTTAETTEEKGSEPQQKVVKEVIGLRKRAQTAEQEAAYWRGVAEGRVKPEKSDDATPRPTSTTQGPPQPPDPSAYGDDWQKYETAKDDYLVAKAKWEVRQEYQQGQAAQSQAEVDRSFNDRIAAVSETDPEVGMVLRATNPQDPYFLPINDHMAAVIKHSEVAPRIIRYLLDNKGEAQRLFHLNPFVAAAELGKIEAKIAGDKPATVKKISQAPEPVKTVTSGAGPALVDDDKMSVDEWMNHRNRQLKAGGA
jgi:hypothetical protein